MKIKTMFSLALLLLQPFRYGFAERPHPGLNYQFPEIRFIDADILDVLIFMNKYSQTALEESSFSNDFKKITYEYAFDQKAPRPRINFRAEKVWFSDALRNSLAQAGLEYEIVAPDIIKIVDQAKIFSDEIEVALDLNSVLKNYEDFISKQVSVKAHYNFHLDGDWVSKESGNSVLDQVLPIIVLEHCRYYSSTGEELKTRPPKSTKALIRGILNHGDYMAKGGLSGTGTLIENMTYLSVESVVFLDEVGGEK